MAYEHKPNSGSLFPNENKTESKHPDFKGTHVDENGKKWNIAAWTKTSQKGEFLSYSISEIKPK